ncbi:hypothetical protein BCR44DRAFT_1433017 [Catenaria anguillulae PL171]|uniref:Uncharacterized protein n=1 Tax=Catenaria anguillulae PL171 TaxID=765915 RepID=A0A1Y2HNR0_9FUNG|nr:hypothetical protein BCR44DRAFT_1433017 [Catenaria anguillulae PL171]
MHIKINTIHILLIVLVLSNLACALPKGGGGGGGRGGGSSGGSRSGSGSSSGGSRSGSGSGGSGSSSGGSKSGGGSSSGGWSSSSPSNPSRGGIGSSLPSRSSGPTGRRTVPILFFGSPSTHVPHPSRPGIVGWYDYDSDDDNSTTCSFRSHDGALVERVACPRVPAPSPASNSAPAWTPTPRLGLFRRNLVAVVVLSMCGFVLF